MFKKIKIFLSVYFFTLQAFAQNNKNVKQIEIIHADVLKYNKSIDANRLIGNVICKHENTFFYCDSMYLFPNQSLKAFGNIRITSDSLIITSKNLSYDASTKIALLENDVICNDGHIQLKTNTLEYNTQTHIAYYPNKANITRNDIQLTSDQGFYYSNDKTLSFKNNVVLKSPDYTIKTDTLFYYTLTDIAHFSSPTIILMDKDYLYCEKGWYDTKHKKAYFSKNPMLYSDQKKLYADSLFYDENTNIGYAYYNIKLIDSTQTNFVFGNYGQYNRNTEQAMITKHPVMMSIYEKKDTIFIACDTIHYEKKDSSSVLTCKHNSRLFHQQFQALAENIIYFQKDSTIHLKHQPKFWFSNNETNCRNAIIYLKNNSIDKIQLDSNVIIVQEADSIYHNKYNQIAGRSMQIYFHKDSIQSIFVNGNAEVYYFLKNENQQWTGITKAKCSKIRVDFENNEIYKISFIDNPESILIPIKKVQPEKEKLPDFKWQPHLRPQRKDIF